MRAVMVMAVWLAVLLAAAGAARGEGPTRAVAVGGVAVRGESVSQDTHGWLILYSTRDAAVWHLPPRTIVGPLGSQDGVARPAAPVLPFSPTAAAAVGSRLYLVDAAGQFPDAEKRVWSLRAVPAGVAGFWATDPGDRLEPSAGLPGRSLIIDFAGTTVGPAALLRGERDGSGPATLMVLGDGGWRRVLLPEGFDGSGATVIGEHEGNLELIRVVPAEKKARVWSFALKPELTAREGGGSISWEPELATEWETGAWGRGKDGGGSRVREPAVVEWAFSELALPDAVAGARAADIGLWSFGRTRVAAAHVGAGGAGGAGGGGQSGGGVWGVWASSGGAWREVWRSGEAPREATVMPLAGSRRVLLSWGGRPTAGGAVAAGFTQRLIEVSVDTGRVMYEGPAKSASSIRASDYRLVAFVLFVVMATALAFIIRGESGADEVRMPKDTALADPLRRCVASAIDVVIAGVIASAIVGTSFGEGLSVAGIIQGRAMVLLLATIGVAVVVGSVSEWLLCRTVGKWLTGCAVVTIDHGSVAAEEGREGEVPGLTLPQAVLRNTIKWVVLPLGVLMFLDPNGRHLGDRMGRSVVVVQISEDEEGDGGGGGEDRGG